MRSVLISIAMLAAYAVAIWATQTRASDLYAFCDAEQTDPCDTLHLMVKDVCAETIRELTDRSARFSCVLADTATRDAYLRSIKAQETDK